jgi:hypothetical protein
VCPYLSREGGAAEKLKKEDGETFLLVADAGSTVSGVRLRLFLSFLSFVLFVCSFLSCSFSFFFFLLFLFLLL